MTIPRSLVVELIFFGFTLWLGAYLLALKSHHKTVRLTGLGLIAYAIALAFELLLDQPVIIILLLPALLWIGAVLHLLPDHVTQREPLIRIWALCAIPVAILTLLNAWFASFLVVALLVCSGIVAYLAMHSQFRNTLAVLAVVTLFFTLSTGLILLPFPVLTYGWKISLLGLDLFALGLVVTIWDAFDEGEAIRAHLLRSFVSAFYYAGALSLLVVLAILMDGDLTFGKLLLLTSIIAFGILTQTFSNHIQIILDRLTFSRAWILNDQRQMFRETADILPRLPALDPASVDEAEFARLTRRAISNLGDLPKLAASPLTNLPSVIQDGGQNPLDRARALKTILLESIARLKPQSESMFGSSDEWRYYNALYFPYVAGVKPYARRMDEDSLDAASSKALEWFRTAVPERTLHNWQNAAAKLVAEDIKNRR